MAATKRRGPAASPLLADMFDAEFVAERLEAEATDAFQRVDGDLETEYRCPRCSYEWSGNPKPPTGVSIEEDDEPTTT